MLRRSLVKKGAGRGVVGGGEIDAVAAVGRRAAAVAAAADG